MRKSKKVFLSALLTVCALCLCFGLIACGKKDKEATYGYGEEGWYYHDAANSTEYLMSLQSGTYMISDSGSVNYSGTYSYKEGGSVISFTTSDDETFEAAFADDALSLVIEGATPYTFLKKIDYTVTFMDGSTKVGTQSVTYGRQAYTIDAEKDGYIFIGWFEDAAFTTQYRFDTSVTADLTLYAYYIAEDETAQNFEVQFIDTDGKTVLGTAATVNGVVLDIYFPETKDELSGWWVSATNKADELTYEYNGETLCEATKLFAVGSDSLGASVYDDRVTWKAAVSSVTVSVDGENIISNTSGNSLLYDFSSLSTGVHTVTLSGGRYTEILTYVSNGLARVSNFAIYGTSLVHNRVEDAQYYLVTVECGNEAHTETMVYNGNTLSYDFSNCVMGKDGIKFTVYACATGYVTSESDTFVFSQTLDSAVVTIDSSTDTASWNDVAGATAYEIYVCDDTGATSPVYTLVATTVDTEFSFKYYGIGSEIGIAVKPVAPWYYSETSVPATYTKSTLAAPVITGINEYFVSWSEVTGAEVTNYIIYVNGTQVGTVGSSVTTFALLDEGQEPRYAKADSYEITVRAVNADNTYQNSQMSDSVYATEDELSPLLTYNDGVVSWNYVLSVGTYYVQINDEEEIAVEGKNSFAVTFTQSGENVIKVYFKTSDDATTNAVATITVTAYAVIFESEGGNQIDTIYVAKGDTLSLATPEYQSGEANFLGWYTLPNPTGMALNVYGGDGVVVESGTTFSKNSSMVLYACWEVTKQNITFVSGNYGVIIDDDGEGQSNLSTTIPVNYTTNDYGFPTVETTDGAYMFCGWYTRENGKGIQISNYDGTWKNPYTDVSVTTLYAYWIKVFSFSVSSYENVQYAAVSAGSDIDLAPNGTVTVPETYTINGTEYTVGILNTNAFGECYQLEIINIPDTIVYVATTGNGYSYGSSAFSVCYSLAEVNVYATGDPENTSREIRYYSSDGILYLKTSDGGAELVFYPNGKHDTEFVIPEYVTNENEYELVAAPDTTAKVYRPVTTVAYRALYSNSYLTKVVFPATMELIGSEAFASCTALREVTFNDTLTTVQNNEVSAATGLTISDSAFGNCVWLTDLALPSRLDNLSGSAFNGCDNMTTVSVTAGGIFSTYNEILYKGNNYEEVYFCPRGRSADVVWNTATSKVGDNAFYGCTKLTSVSIPGHITSIGDYAFYGCTSIATLDFGNRTQNSQELSIGAYAFYGCRSLTSVTISAGVNTIGTQAFANCNITTVYFDCYSGISGEDLDIAEGAFGTRVTTIVIGANVPFMANILDILGMDKLVSVSVDAANNNYGVDSYGVLYGYNYEGTAEGPAETATDVVLLWSPEFTGSTHSYSTAEGCTEIRGKAFENNLTLQQISIGASVKTIGAYAFSGCTYLEEVTIAGGSCLQTIGDYAFAGTAIATFTVPASVEKMGGYGTDEETEEEKLVSMKVFDDCESLTTLKVESGNQNFVTVNSVLYLAKNGNAAELIFSPMENTATEITVPNTVETVWAGAFYNNHNIKKITFTDSATGTTLTLGEGAFSGADGLEEVVLPASLTKIADNLFMNCVSLKTVNIPYTVKSIGDYAFYGCTSLTQISFNALPEEQTDGDDPLSIGVYAFANCTSLTEIALPDRTNELRTTEEYLSGNGTTQVSRVFDGDSSLVTVTLGAELTSLPAMTFSYLDNLSNVYFANTGSTSKLSTMAIDTFFHVAEISQDLAVEIPGTVTEVDRIFDYTCVKTFTLNEGTTSLGQWIFGMNSGSNKALVTEIYIPASASFKGNASSVAGSFTYCTYLETVTFADGFSGAIIPYDNFRGCTSLENITLPASVTEIGNSAFGSCTSLTKIKVGGSGNSFKFGNTVFSGCTSLTTVEFETGITTLTFGSKVFNGCTALTEFTFPTTTGTITLGDQMFYGCSNLTKIVLSGNITSFGTFLIGAYGVTEVDTTNNSHFVSDMTGQPLIYNSDETAIALVYGDLTGTLTISTNITSIGEGVFQNQITMTSVELPETLTSIGKNAFNACVNLKNLTFYTYTGSTGRGSLSIGESAFEYTKLEEIDLNGFTSVSVGNYAFRYSGLKSFEMQSTITLGTGVFYSCTGLESIVIGESMTSFANDMFYGCTNLRTIVTKAEDLDPMDGVADLTNITSIGTRALYNTSIEKVVLHPTATPIASYTNTGYSPFYNCKSLETVVLGAQQTLYTYFFRGCSSLKAVGATENDLYVTDTVGGTTPVVNLKNITATTFAFYNCTSIEMVLLTANTTVYKQEFYGCTSLKTVGYWESVTATTPVYELGVAKFTTVTFSDVGQFYHSGIEKVVLPSQGVTLGQGSASNGNQGPFGGCEYLTEIDLGGQMTTLGSYEFEGCTALEKVTGFGSVISMGTYAFANCTSLKTIGTEEGVIDVSNVTTLSNYVFYNCASIESVLLVTGEEITAYAFSGCSSLSSLGASKDVMTYNGRPVVNLTGLTLEATTSTTGGTAGHQFMDCTGIEILVLGSGNYSVGTAAFYGCTSLTTIAKETSAITIGTADLTGVTVRKATFARTAIVSLILDNTSTINTEGSGTGEDMGAFGQCFNLEYVDIDEMTSIGAWQFYGCESLETVVAANCKSIGAAAFYGCTSLKTFATSQSGEEGLADLSDVNTLGKASFANTAIEKVVLGSASIVVGTGTGTNASTFGENSKLTEVDLGSVSSLPAYAFYRCTALTTLYSNYGTARSGVIDLSGVTAVGNYTFSGCSSVTSVNIGSNVMFGTATFAGCEITSIDISGVTEITEYLFYGCDLLVSITGIDSVTKIGDYGLYGCGALETFGSTGGIFDLNTVKEIGTAALGGCVSIEDFDVTSSADFTTEDGVLYTTDGDMIFVFGDISGELVIADSVAYIGPYTYTGNTAITSLVIPATVTEIGAHAFDGCSNLKTVTFLGADTVIGEYAFADCVSLVTVGGDYGVATIGDYAFYEDVALESVHVGSNAVSVGDYAFYDCESLSELILDEGVGKLGKYMCVSCDSLESVTIPVSVTLLDACAFLNCELLSEVTFVEAPEGLEADYPLEIAAAPGWSRYAQEGSAYRQYVTNGMFAGCSALEDLVLPSRLSSLGNGAFSGTGLVTVVIGSSELATIPEGTFCECESLRAVRIREGVTTIKDETFAYCSSLEFVHLPDTLITIVDFAFYLTSSDLAIIMSDGVSGLTTWCWSEEPPFVSISGATFYITSEYKYAKMNLLYLDSSAPSYEECWLMSAGDVTLAYYTDIADYYDTNSGFYDFGAHYWYYNDGGNIVEWYIEDGNIVSTVVEVPQI